MLSKEKIEKAKEIMNKFMNNKIQRDKLERDCRCGGWKIGDVYKHLELNPAIDTFSQYIAQLEQENNKQNKIIDEMAEYIAEIDGSDNLCDKNKHCSICIIKDCKECIKQYFEKKVEVENNMNNNKMIKNGEHYTQGNADDLGKALEGLGQFCHNWCMNCKETEEKAEPIFRCNGCDFKNDNGNCRIKIFLSNKASDNPERYTCME